MKKLTLIAFAALMAFFVIQGCEKGRLDDVRGEKIKAFKTELIPFEDDTLLFTGAAATDSVKWTVTPADLSYIQIKGNAAIIRFFREGTYSVSAQKVSGGVAQSISIKVARYVPVFVSEPGTTKTTISTSATPDTVQYIPITGDIKVGLSYYRIPSDDSVSINFNPQTVNTYCSKSIMQYTSTVDASKNFTLDIVNLRAPKNCAGATAPDWQVWTGDVFKRKLIGLGTHQLTIKFNGVTYTGTIVVTTTNTTINWNYTSGVIMLSHVING
ncbi:MAG: hypothetical protein V4560_19630 [Bacteroidota bacterium]